MFNKKQKTRKTLLKRLKKETELEELQTKGYIPNIIPEIISEDSETEFEITKTKPTIDISLDDFIQNAINTSIQKNKVDSIFYSSNQTYFTTPKVVRQNQFQDIIDTYGIPTEIKYDHWKSVKENLNYDTLYTKQDLNLLGIDENNFVKVYHDGSLFYKLIDIPTNIDIYKVFKQDTKFALNESDTEFSNLQIKLKKGEILSKWDDYKMNDTLTSLLQITEKDDENRIAIKNQIFLLNKQIHQHLNEFNVKTNNDSEIKDEVIGDLIIAKHKIEQKQDLLNEKIYNLKQTYTTNNTLYKIKNLFFHTWDENNIYFKYQLANINFDIYPQNRIVVISDDSVSNQLLIDVLRGDEYKTNGYIYKNVFAKNQWIDVDQLNYNFTTISNIDLNNEMLYALNSPNYLTFGLKRKENIKVSMQKIFNVLGRFPSENNRNTLIKLMLFEPYLNLNIFDLDDLTLEKFFTLCDILIGKKVVLIKSICQGMNYSDKLKLLNFLNDYFTTNNTTLIYASDDLNDVNLIATHVMVLKQGQIVSFEPITKILDTFKTVNDYVLHYIKHGITKNYDIVTFDKTS